MTGREIVQHRARHRRHRRAGIHFDGVRRDRLARRAAREAPEQGSAIERLDTAPRGFVGELRPYQRRGFAWLEFLKRTWGLGACLADDMGLGKTIQALALQSSAAEWRAEDPARTAGRVPTSVLSELGARGRALHAEAPVSSTTVRADARATSFVQHASEDTGARAHELRAAAPRHRDLTAVQLGKGVVLDEAQNIKNPDTKQSQRRSRRSSPPTTASRSRARPSRTTSVISVVDHGLPEPGLSSAARRAVQAPPTSCPIQGYRDPRGLEQLEGQLTSPFVLRRLKTDRTIISDLPDKLEMKVYCTLTASRRPSTSSVVAGRRDARSATPRASSGAVVVLATLVEAQADLQPPRALPRRRRRTSSGADRASSASQATEMLEEDDRSRRPRQALIFTQFAKMGRILLQPPSSTTSTREVMFLHGGVPKKKRDASSSTASRAPTPTRRRSSSCRSRPVASASTSPAPITYSTSTAGGTRPSRTRRPTAPSGSGRQKQRAGPQVRLCRDAGRAHRPA